MKIKRIIITGTVSLWLLFANMLQAGNLEQMHAYLQQRLNPQAGHAASTCGFQDQMRLRQHLNELAPAERALAKTLLSDTSRAFQLYSPSGHFILHYDKSGTHAVPDQDADANGVPDFVDSAAVYFDYAWHVEIDQLGFNPPPDSLGNAASVYHIYFSNLGYYGLTNFDPAKDLPAAGNNYASYIEIDNDFSGSNFYTNGYDAIKVTAAHEFNHAIQLGYHFRSDWSDVYFMEMLSTWLEDYVYDQVNDYWQYLPRLYSNLRSKPFNSYDGWNEYGNSLYLHMLQKKFGPSAPRIIWESIPDDSSLTAIDKFLKLRSSSFAKEHNEYGSWLYFSGERADTSLSFPEGTNYPTLKPLSGTDKVALDLNGLSLRLVNIFTDSSLTYRGRVSANGTGGVFNHLTNGQYTQGPHPFGSWQSFYQSSSLPLVAVLSNSEKHSLTGLNYILEKAPDSNSNEAVYVHRKADYLQFRNIKPETTIRIFSLNGRPVCKLQVGFNSDGYYNWDLRDANGVKAASGIYIYTVSGNGPAQLGKFALVR